MAAMASKFNFECVIQYYTDHGPVSRFLGERVVRLFKVFRNALKRISRTCIEELCFH